MKEQKTWRMPLIDELKTLVVKGMMPAIDAKVFPGCPAAGFWSGSPYAGNSSYAWYVYFLNGNAFNDYRSGGYHVRLVRGGQDFDPLWSALDTEGRWYDCGDGLAFDRQTGLQWQRYCVGQQWTDEGMPSGNPELLTWDQAMGRFGNGVPEGEEEDGDSQESSSTSDRQTARKIIDSLLDYAVQFAQMNGEPNDGDCREVIEAASKFLANTAVIEKRFGADDKKAGNFLDQVANLSIWGYDKNDGTQYEECEEPSDGYLDSHLCLMGLIEDARKLQ